jgi:hypothetical protein
MGTCKKKNFTLHHVCVAKTIHVYTVLRKIPIGFTSLFDLTKP